ncbi:DUF4083 domain-containing protein [Pseudalkalibacillus hwajinpoensis]|uniref:DUF4083 domain-containing protein n=1 Tax=Guptibacillus hwajinpoensis TaxID=208199 RepID=UPI00325B8156
MNFHWGDVLYQVISLVILVVPIGLIVYFIRESFRRKRQLNRIEEKVDAIQRNRDE